MTREDAISLHAELEQLARRYPGADEAGKARLRQALFRFRQDDQCGPYLREKAGEVGSFLEPWLSARKWQKWGPDPERLKAIIGSSLFKLRRAIEKDFPKHPRSTE
jgi:hypothetical protein